MGNRAPDWQPHATGEVVRLLSNICFEGEQVGLSVAERKARMIRALNKLPANLPLSNIRVEREVALKCSTNMAGWVAYQSYLILSRGMHWDESRRQIVRAIQTIPHDLPLRAACGRAGEIWTIKDHFAVAGSVVAW